MVDSNKIVQERINDSFDGLYHTTADGAYVPFVCITCDKFVDPKLHSIVTEWELLDVFEDILRPSKFNNVHVNSGIARDYTYSGDCGELVDGELERLAEMLLSPRGCYVRQIDDRKKSGFVMCRSCRYGLSNKQMPKFAIANNFWEVYRITK